MKKGLFPMDYHSTYYFANIINNVVFDSFNYLRSLDRFFQFEAVTDSFPKFSNLHRFIYFTLESIIIDERNGEAIENVNDDNYRNANFYVNELINYHKISHLSFSEWYEKVNISKSGHWEDHVSNYYSYLLDGPLDQLLRRLTAEVFYILFQNRLFLKEFNELVASHIESLTLAELDRDQFGLFAGDGILKRCYVNQWVKKAVFFRDRGHCCGCHTNLTNLVTMVDSEIHYDHIVPLDKSGANDISNIQLLCSVCNEKKGTMSITFNFYQLWYEEQ